MGRLLEHDTKTLLDKHGIATPRGAVARSPGEARELATQLAGPVAVKAHIVVGRRGKAGAVLLVDTPEGAEAAAGRLIGTAVRGYPVESVLIEERVPIDRELYLSLTIDRDAARTRILASTQGGVEIEELTREEPDALASVQISATDGLADHQARSLWRRAGISGELLPRLGSLTGGLYRVFRQLDAYLLEINPLVITTAGDLVAVGAVMAIDDASLVRHPDLRDRVQVGSEKVWRPLTRREERVNEINAAEPYRGSARYLELEGGDIGFLCGGGGASLVLFDSLVNAGGHPANYSEFGGNPTETKVAGLTSVVLSKPGVRGLFIAHNITNNTQVDVIARGVVRALRDAHLPKEFPVVAREVGVHDAEGRAIFEAAGIRYCGEESTLTDAARAMVELMRQRYGGNNQ